MENVWRSIQSDSMIQICFWCTAVICGILLILSVLSCTKWKKYFLVRWFSTVDLAQLAITIGVAFTFVGIIYSLVNFDVTDVKKIRESIATFLGGMKTAFITSIVGIFSGIVIKIFQSFAEKNAQDNSQSRSNVLLQNTEKILYTLVSITEAIESLKESIDRSSSVSVTEAIESLKESIDRSSSGTLERAISNLSDKMTQHVIAEQETQSSIQGVADKLSEQTKSIDKLGMSLQNSSQSQVDAINFLGNSLTASEAAQTEEIRSLSENLKLSGLAQIKAIDDLGETLGKTLEDSGHEQISRLDAMNTIIERMSDYSEKAYENSVTNLREAQAYQENSLNILQEQLKILSSNTDRITEMKNAFEKFLDDMARKNNEEFIKALNESMKDLNQRLTEQFGDNFKQLNSSVIKLKDWQEDYKNVIESTTQELAELNGVFQKFSTDVAPAIADTAERLQRSLERFAETSRENVNIQIGLTEASQRLNDSIKQSEKVAENLKLIHDGLTDYQKDFLETLEESLAEHLEKTISAVQAYAEILDAVITQNQQNVVNQMQNTTNVLAGIISQQEAYSKSLANYQQQLIQTLENSFEEHQDNIVTALHASVEKITEEMRKLSDKFKESISDIDETALTFSLNMTNNLTQFDTTVEEILQKIHLALDGFNTDFQAEITDAMTRLETNLEAVLKSNSEISAKQGEQLAALLGTVHEKMVEGYTNLANQIVELDIELRERRAL